MLRRTFERVPWMALSVAVATAFVVSCVVLSMRVRVQLRGLVVRYTAIEQLDVVDARLRGLRAPIVAALVPSASAEATKSFEEAVAKLVTARSKFEPQVAAHLGVESQLSAFDLAWSETEREARGLLAEPAALAERDVREARFHRSLDDALDHAGAAQAYLRKQYARLAIEHLRTWRKVQLVALVASLFGIAAVLLLWRSRREIARRRSAESELRSATAGLELHVAARTAELSAANAALAAEVARREVAQRELARSNRDLEQFAYSASHDLQEPIRMVASYLDLLERRAKEKLTDDEREFVGFARDGALRMRELVMSLLAYSRAGRGDAPFEEFELRSAVDRALANLRLSLEEKDCEVVVGELPRVRGRPLEIALVFQNLFSNALKFKGEQRARIEISAAREGTVWRVVVRDAGIGVDPAHAEAIFEPFRRVSPGGRVPGTGLGLAICRRIVERHGGTIHVEPGPGAGAAFVFTLPVEAPAPAAPLPSEREAVGTRRDAIES